MKHVSESVLGFLALDPALVPDRAGVEQHLQSCAECRATLDEIRQFDEALAEPGPWDAAGAEREDTKGDELRLFVTRFAQEDAAAIELLKDFEDPAAAAHFVWEDIPARTAYQTGGVARRLCKLANGMVERQPLYALALAEAATRLAAILPGGRYPRGTVHELRGEAWKEQANAFYRLGRFQDALDALTNAETEYRRLPHEGIGIVAVQYVRAGVLYEQDQFDAAETLAQQSAAGALHLGDTERYMRARHRQGEIRFYRQEFAAAAEVFASVLAYGEERQSSIWIARESLNVGRCYVELGRLDDASPLLHRALRVFGELGLTTEVTKTNWAIARLLFLQGHTREAIYRLGAAIRDLSGRGMLTDAAIAAVHLAEMLSAVGRTREIPKLLSGVVQTFTAAGRLSGALAALAYLREATVAGPVEPAVFSYVSRFLTKADHQPELLFAPPPRSSE
jgi:tetratricopeptide (TPR) repeat protein